MKRIVSKVLFILIFFICIITVEVLSYSDELFEFDLSSKYNSTVFEDKIVFANIDNPQKEITIYTFEEYGIKTSVKKIETEVLKDYISKIVNIENISSIEKESSLGEEEAARIILEEEGKYTEIYFIQSHNYVHMVSFSGTTYEEITNEDFEIMKATFELKHKVKSPFKNLVVIVIIILILGYLTRNYRPRINLGKIHNYEVDYKNMTEQDLKRVIQMQNRR